jgi:hypothetical protein
VAEDDDTFNPSGADGRTLALSDGLFAIATTLLVLSIDTPPLAPGHESELGSALLDRRDELYPTEVRGAYASQPAAVALYAVTLALIATAGGLMGRLAGRAGSERWWVVPAIVLLAIPLSFAVGAYALLVWLALPLARARSG